MKFKNKTRKERLFDGLLLLLALIFLISAGLLTKELLAYRKGQTAYEKLTQAVTEKVLLADFGAPAEEAPPLQVDFAALRAINPQVTGWLFIPDTSVSYPVMQGEDNAYYLNHLPDGTVSKYGSLFADARCEEGSGITVVYGHNLMNGKMFADLMRYQKPDYFEAHQTGWYQTPEGSARVEWVAALLADAEDGSVYRFALSAEEKAAYAAAMQQRSLIDTGVRVEGTDALLLLSTCTNRRENERFVLLGRLVPVNGK